MYNVVVADHQPITVKGLTSLLSDYPEYFVADVVLSGTELLKSLRTHRPEILILEINLPDINGSNLLHTIKHEFPDLKVLIFSGLPEEIYASRFIRSGVGGYVCKSASTKLIINSVHQIAQGISMTESNGYSPEILMNRVGERNAIEKYKKLSLREIDVLNLMFSGKRNKDIAEALEINEKTVSTYKKRILKKMKAENLVDLINLSKMFHYN